MSRIRENAEMNMKNKIGYYCKKTKNIIYIYKSYYLKFVTRDRIPDGISKLKYYMQIDTRIPTYKEREYILEIFNNIMRF